LGASSIADTTAGSLAAFDAANAGIGGASAASFAPLAFLGS
jgi:hypothetical protein